MANQNCSFVTPTNVPLIYTNTVSLLHVNAFYCAGSSNFVPTGVDYCTTFKLPDNILCRSVRFRPEISGPQLIRTASPRPSLKAITRPFFQHRSKGSRGPYCVRRPRTTGFETKYTVLPKHVQRYQTVRENTTCICWFDEGTI